MNNLFKTCPNCNTVNQADALFCRECAYHFEAQAPINPQPVEVQPAEPSPEDIQPEVENNAPVINEQPTVVDEQEPVKPEQEPVNPVQETPFVNEQPPVYSSPAYSQPIYKKENTYNNTNNESEFNKDGISDTEFMVYIGKNQDKFMPKFKSFMYGNKVAFSPLVFLLSLLVSPIAGAFWFFHRKINKVGSIVLSIALLLTIGSCVLDVFMINDMKEPLKEIIEITEKYGSNLDDSINSSGVSKSSFDKTNNYDFDIYDEEIDDYMDRFNDGYYFDDGYYGEYDDYYNNQREAELKKPTMELINVISKYSALSSLFGILNIAFAIIIGLYAKYFYFKDAVAKIMAIKQANPTPECINDIYAEGGTSCVLWIIGTVIYVFASIVFASILIINLVSSCLPL